jgi:hypothetical protein
MPRPAGSQNKDKPFRDALRMELAAAGDDHKALREIARNLIAQAGKNDPSALPAIKEIGDRLDGKPAQALEMSGSLAMSHEEALNELDDGGSERSHDASRADDTKTA